MDADALRGPLTDYAHGKLFGAEAAKTGQRRRCPYVPKFPDAIRGWYEGWDMWWAHRPEWEQKERKPTVSET